MPSIYGLARRTYNGFNKGLARVVIPRLLARSGKGLALRTLGKGAGAWTVPASLITPDSICYCVGVGLDATFDMDLAGQCGAQVISFDPTPRAVTYMEGLAQRRPNHRFEPVAVWNSNTTLQFYAPMNNNHVNLSTRDIHATGKYVLVPAETLPSIMARLGHDRIDLLKIDIEGSWDIVIADLAERRIAPKVLCVEFDTPTSPAKVRRAVRSLAGLGLKPIHRQRDNVLFVRDDLLQ